MTDGGSSCKGAATETKVCGVCGDKALGYNFNAITCESCKAFFRRNALKTKEFKCPFNDTCKVDLVTRRFCQKCRLKKCFTIGMKKEWIMTDEEKKIKKQKIEENRHKRQSTDHVKSTPGSPPETPTDLDLLTPKSEDCGALSPPSTDSDCRAQLVSPSSSGRRGGMLTPPTSSPSPDHADSTVELAPDEYARLHELVVANKAMKSPITDDDRFRSSVDPSLINVINLTDIAIRRLIKMSKKIDAFRRLSQEDQIALLKGGCTELMILRSVMTYNPENDCWLGPKGPRRSGVMRIRLDVLREAKGNLYEEHKRFIHSFAAGWRADENIMLLLGAVTLFTPERPNVLNRDVIRREQESYYALLRRYLDSIYSGCEARATYLKLTQRIEELHLLNENHVRVFLDVNPKEVEPLLIEIFDLKNH